MSPRYRQQGLSLLSLMIGLVISMIVILGMMGLLSTSIKSTAGASRDARITSERTSGLLIASMRLQAAGYGIANADRNDHLLLLSSASLTNDRLSGTAISGDGTGNALVWQTNPAGVSQCGGLYAPADEDEKGLYELVVKNCASVADANSTDWEIRRLIVDTKDIQDPLAVSIIVSTHDSANPCKGFGIAGAGRLSVTLSAQEASGQSLNSTTCLLNFSPSAGATP